MLWDWVTLFLSLFFDSFSTSTLEGLGFLILLALSDCVRVFVFTVKFERSFTKEDNVFSFSFSNDKHYKGII